MQTLGKHYKLNTLVCGDIFWFGFGWARETPWMCVGSVGLMTQQSPGIPVYCLNVCLHTHVWETEHGRKCQHTPPFFSPSTPFIFSLYLTCLMAVVDTVLRVVATTGDCCKRGAQPPTSVCPYQGWGSLWCEKRRLLFSRTLLLMLDVL